MSQTLQERNGLHLPFFKNEIDLADRRLRQDDDKTGMGRVGIKAYRSLVGINDIFRNTKSNTSDFPHFFGGKKWVKELGRYMGGDAGPTIRDSYFNPIAL